jgi:excisionase family DNA binding protein
MENLKQGATKIVAVTVEELQSLMTTIVRNELELLITNPHFGDGFKDELWDRSQAASFLGISEQTLIKLVLEGKILAQRSGRKYHFLKSAVLNFLRAKTEY